MRVLPVIVLAQFCCTSLWFAGNAVMGDLVRTFGISPQELGTLTSSVQFGFILGTLCFAILSIADRFSPSRVFFLCALAGALTNLGMLWPENTLQSLIGFRFLTGFCLAGIYPVGMKIAADYFREGLGKSLGFLVGALVLGTAFPHLLKSLSATFPWSYVVYGTSFLAISGGTMILFSVPDGPYRKAASAVQLSAFLQVFRKPTFRSAAFGYFGHMWELYAFWAFVPVLLKTYQIRHNVSFSISAWSFGIIAIGGVACALGGYLSQRHGPQRVVALSLGLSGICCFLIPFVLLQPSTPLFLGFLLLWGMAVIADSPLFSTLVAQRAPGEIKGTALTIVNSIGFAVTIVSIQTLSMLLTRWDMPYVYWILACGPIFGLWSLQYPRQKSNLEQGEMKKL
ncbi:MFS transporter [Cryomorphaceae bacterium]|nr:MFS transporter [Cryomorphaceae bacterium]